MKTIYTHKTKGTKLTFVKHFDAKTVIVLTEEGQELPMAIITLTRWYDVAEEAEVVTEEVIETEETVEAPEAVLTEEVKEAVQAKRNTRKMVPLSEVMEGAYFSKCFSTETRTADIYAYGYGKFTRTETVLWIGENTYRFGTVFTYEGIVVSSYYLLNDSKEGLESIQRKGVKSATPTLAKATGLSEEEIHMLLTASRQVFKMAN